MTALQQIQRQLLLHLEHSPLAVVEWDSQFRIKRWAGAAEALGAALRRLLGGTPAETDTA